MKLKIFYNKTYNLALILLSFFWFTSCEDGKVNIFTVEDDANLGKQIDAEIRSKPGEYPLYNFFEPNQYVQNIVTEIINSPLVKYRSYFPYKVQILKDDKVVNAFCTPGGYIYVYTGLIKFLDNEATLAGVLGHEIAHAERRHGTNRMTKAYGIQVLLSIALGNNPTMIEQIAANLFSGLYLMKNSRDDEYESDEYSFKYLQTTQWYPGAIKFFFEKVKKDESSPFFEVLLSTHPMPQDRLNAVNKMILDFKIGEPNEMNLQSIRYKNFLNSLP